MKYYHLYYGIILIHNIDENKFEKYGSKKICSYCYKLASKYLKDTGGNVLKFTDYINEFDLKKSIIKSLIMRL